MANRLRELGVIGKNAPTKKTKSVTASDFAIAGLTGFFERRYKRAYSVNNITEYRTIFGEQINSNWYGADAVTGFFDNVVGVNATLIIAPYVGNDGSLYDATTATAQLDDQQTVADKVLQLDSAYREELEFSTSGNRTGYTIENGERFNTTVTGVSSTTTQLFLNSVIGFFEGDIVRVGLTGGDEFSKVTIVDENTKSITISPALSTPPASTDEVAALGFRLRLWRKNIKGIVVEVDTALGEVYCTTEPEVTDFYVENVFATSSWIKSSVLTTTPTDLGEKFPKNISTITYLTGGADGSSPTLPNQWDFANSYFNGLPIRLVANIETANDVIQKELENYCKGRSDTPVAVTHTLKDQDKLQLIDIGNGYQRSDDVFQGVIGTWLGVTDVFANSVDAEDRQIPPNGHIMGLAIRTWATKGIHYIPTKDMPIFGVNSLINESLGVITNRDRTDIAEAGVNIIQFITGSGNILRNFFTPSTSIDFQFVNGIIMRNFIKISAEDSLQISENTPNSFNQIATDRDAIFNFMFNLWIVGSTGTVPTGETFGQFIKDDDSISTFGDSVEIAIEPPVNTKQSIQAGERNYEVYFRFPAPAGSIFIKVGILL